MPSLEKQLENAKKAVEVAKETYKNAKPTPAKFEELGYGRMNERDIENWVKLHRKSKEKRLQPAIKALKALEVAEAKLGRLEDKVYNKKGGTRRSKRGLNKTRRSI